MSLDPNFICQCGHRNGMHVNIETGMGYDGKPRRRCIEWKDVVYIKNNWYHLGEQICACIDFIPDNLKTLEHQSEEVVQAAKV